MFCAQPHSCHSAYAWLWPHGHAIVTDWHARLTCLNAGRVWSAARNRPLGCHTCAVGHGGQRHARRAGTQLLVICVVWVFDAWTLVGCHVYLGWLAHIFNNSHFSTKLHPVSTSHRKPHFNSQMRSTHYLMYFPFPDLRHMHTVQHISSTTHLA